MLRAASLLAVNGSSPCAVTPRTHPVTLEPVGRSEGGPGLLSNRPVVQGAGVEPAPAGFSVRRSAC